MMCMLQILVGEICCFCLKNQYFLQRVAWACCWLATKLEEAPRRLRDVLSVFVRIDRRREGKGDLAPLDIYGQVKVHPSFISVLKTHYAPQNWTRSTA